MIRRLFIAGAVASLVLPFLCVTWPHRDWDTGFAWRLSERMMVSARYAGTGIVFARVIRVAPLRRPSAHWNPPDRFWYPVYPDNPQGSELFFLDTVAVRDTQFFDCLGWHANRTSYLLPHPFRALEGIVSIDRVLVPFWSLWLPAGFATFAFVLRAGLCRRRLVRGSCVQCGYDLRASKDRCPECGTPVPAEVKA
jgi:hypothetical protein